MSTSFIRADSRPTKHQLDGRDATILSLVAESPTRYTVGSLEKIFGDVSQRVRDIAAAILGEDDKLYAKPEEERQTIIETADRMKRGAAIAAAHTMPYIWEREKTAK